MVVKLYVQLGSSPSRAAWMTLKHLDIPAEIKSVDALKGEQLTQDFLKINPCHTLPVLDDNGYIIWESRAIQIYLAEKYGDGKDNSLYPEDNKRRGRILSMLNFDIGTLYKEISDWMFPQVIKKEFADEEKTKQMEEKFAILENFLSENKFLCGEYITLADLSVLASITYPSEVLEYNYRKYPNISSYINKLKSQLPYYDECAEGISIWRDMAKMLTN